MPELLPDELLYSFLGRMSALNALGNTRDRMHLLFGERNVLPVIDLPTRLQYLQAILGRLSPWGSALEIIDHATVYPYHRPFLTSKRHAAVESIMLGASGKSLKVLMGRVANRFGAAPNLRFCSNCSASDIGRYGMSYWHCTHQLPGVTVCPIHRINLTSYSVSCQQTDRQRFILAPGIFPADDITKYPSPHQITFALMSADLCNARLPVLDGSAYYRVYKDAVLQLGFRRKRRVDYAELVAAVRSHYADFDGFPHRERLLSTPCSPLSWLRTLIERPQRSSHPICHLLLIGFLFKTVECFSRLVVGQPRQGGHLCNTGAEGERPPRHPLKDELLQNLTLSCREVARLTNCSVNTIVSRRRILGLRISERPKSRLIESLPKIIESLKNETSPQLIAIEFGTSLSSIYRIKAQFADIQKQHTIRRIDEERDRRRRKWKEALNASKGQGMTAARKLSAATYAWLYRNDKEWLRHESAGDQVHRTPRVQVNWQNRDKQFCSLVSAHVARIYCQATRPRISLSLMIRHIGDANVRANIQHLPKLRKLIGDLEETQFSYQCVRMNHAVKALVWAGKPVVNWRVQRLAGVRTWTARHSEFVIRLLAVDRERLNNE